MKTAGIFMFVFVIVAGIVLGIQAVMAHYQYENQYESYWNLADKASSISKKAEYIDLFVARIQTAHLEGKYNAVFLTTPDNSFDKNYEMLISLRDRLKEIQTMDVRSFEYQTAIQQITAQEQGEANQMMDTIHGIWVKANFPLLWNWILGTIIIIGIIIGTLGALMVTNDY